ncbi:MAG: FHA domain-containing protein [Deltaproteobacteria bacterium]|nr:FHA domain-containing protein [Deltaproteobacteria bacterium]
MSSVIRKLEGISRVVIVGLVVAFGQVLVAHAAPEAATSQVEVLYEVVMPDLTDPKQAEAVPIIKATVIGAPNQPMEKFVLVDKSAKPTPVEIKASKLTPFLKSTEKLAIVIVMNGWEMWIGNDREVPAIKEDDPSRYPGVLVELRSALDKLKFQESGPPGSLGMVITYGDRPTIRVPMGPLADITGSKLGTQQDYFGTTGVELVSAIRLAMSELKKVQVSRRVLIVVCDGNDTNNDAAKAQLLDLKKQAAQDQVQTFAIVYKAKLSGESNIIPIMIPQTAQVTTAENIAATIANILSRMDDRKYLEFPIYNPKTETGLTFDGKAHDLIVRVDKEESEVTQVQLKVWNLPSGGGFPWLVLIVVFVVLFLLIFVMVKIFKKKPVEAPAPAPMMAPMPMDAPKPMGPMKTVMIGQGGDEGGFPVVGWLVPLNGQHAYQTMRLRSSMTKIGTAPPADIVINDGFMSTEHCQINCSPQGFTLIDGGSTNGSYVNERRVTAKHDLVDNDLVTFGKTNFKFKSIV